MDTTNMVKGLDQLGASSGMALGSLSKDLVNAADGAISLRDAMDAVAKGSAAGLSSTQILRMGDAAKKASQALGLSMPDAISRLSRGIAKIEPELLDELGIYVKIEDATRNYALALGKPASALTDFEKRQGFANAVLEQAEKKFNNIKIDSNPYAKLSASLANLAQTGLEAINKFIGPVVKLLSENPTALLVVVGLIGKSLLSQAIPAMGQYRDSLKKQNKEALDNINILEDQRSGIRALIEEQQALQAAEKNTAAFRKTQAAAGALGSAAGTSSKTKTLLTQIGSRTKPAGEMAEIQALTDLKVASEKRIQELSRKTYTLTTAQSIARKAANDQEIADLRKITEAMEKEIQTAERARAAEGSTPAAGKTGIFGSITGFFSKRAADKRTLEAAQIKSTSANVLENTSKAYDAGGLSAGFRSLTDNLKLAREGLKQVGEEVEPAGTKFSRFRVGLTAFRGVGVLAAGVFGTIASALSGVGTVASGIGITIAILDSIFSTNAKQSKALSEAYDRLSSAVQTVDDMFVNLAAADPLERFSTEAITARATAFNELTTGLGTAITKVQEKIAASSGWDKFLDNARDAVSFVNKIPLLNNFFTIDKSTIGKQAEEASKAVAQAIRSAGEGIVSRNAEDAIKRITGVDARDIEGLNAVFEKSPEKIKPVQEELKKLGVELSSVAGKAQQVDSDFKEASKTLDTILIAAIPTEPLAKLGQDMLKLGNSLSSALEEPVLALKNLADIAKDTSKLRFLNPDVAVEFIKAGDSIKETLKTIENFKTTIENLKTERAKLEPISLQQKSQRGGGSTDEAKEAQKQMAAIDAEIKRERKEISAEAAKQATLIVKLQNESVQIAAKGAEYIKTAIATGAAKAALDFRSAILGALGGGEETIIAQLEITKQQIALDIKGLESTQGLIDVQEKLRLEIELSTAEAKLARLNSDKSEFVGADLAKQKEETQAFIRELTAVKQESSTPSIDKLQAIIRANSTSDKNPEASLTPDQRAKAVVAGGRMAASIASTSNTAQIDTAKLKIRTAEEKAVTDRLDAQNNKYKEQLGEKQKLKDLAQQELDLITSKQPYLSEEQQAAKNTYESSKLQYEQDKRAADLANERRKAEAVLAVSRGTETGVAAAKRLENLKKMSADNDKLVLKENLLQQEKNQTAILENIHKRDTLEVEIANRRQTEATELANTNKQITDAQVGLDDQRLEFENSIGALTEREYGARKLVNELARIERDSQAELNNLLDESLRKLRSLRLERDNPGITNDQLMELINQSLAERDLTAARKEQIEANQKLLEQQAQFANNPLYKDAADRQKLVNDIGGVIYEGLFEGGKNGAKSIRKLIQDALTKPFKLSFVEGIKNSLIKPLIESFSGITNSLKAVFTGKGSIEGVSEAISDFGGTVKNLSTGFGNGIGDAFSKFATSSIGEKLGLSQADPDSIGGSGRVLSEFGQTAGKVLSSIGSAFAGKGIQDSVTDILGGYKLGGTGGKVLNAAVMIGSMVPIIGPLISGIVGGAINALFGRKLKDTGIQGTFGPDGFQGQSYRKYKGGFFRSNKTKYQDLSADIEDPISDAFKLIKTQTAFFATSLGQQTTQIENFTASIKFSTKRMSQDQIAARFQYELDKIAESMAATVLAGTNYRKSGETNVQTLQKLSTSLLGVNTAFKELGIATLGVGLSTANVARNIVDLVGGLDQFSSLTSKFYDNFYTDTEKFDNTTKKVKEAFAGVGLAVPRTREEFRSLITGLDKSRPTYAATFAALLKISDSFAAIIPPTEELADKLERLKDARDKEAEALQSTIDKLKSSIQSLKDYRESLLGGDLSTLTPGEKYNQAKSIALETARIAQGPAVTESEIAARDAALSKLPSATDAWLNASRIMYASSDKYTQDFTQVLGILDATSSALSTQQTDAERQLKELETSTGFLGAIVTNTLTTAQLLEQLFSSPEAKQAAIIAAGMAPTAPGTTTPQVNNQLVQTISVLETQITKLNEQIKELRTEQQQQTTQVVIATYDANNRNADEVTAKYEELWNASNWSQRSAVAIA